MTAQEFSTWLKHEALPIYQQYKEIEALYKEPAIPAIPAAEVVVEKKAPNYLLYTVIGLGTLAVIIYAIKKQ